MTDKERFIEEMKIRTKKFAADIILFVDTLKKCKASDVITCQLVKSATSEVANYRAACRARSKAEFYSKMSIAVEEADESEFWLELIDDTNLSSDQKERDRLLKEANELLKIFSTARSNTK